MTTFHRPLILLALLAAAAHAGPNAGFTVSVDAPRRVENPEVGQTIEVGVRVAGTSLVKNTKARVLYDPALLEYLGFVGGDLIAGAPGFPDVSADSARVDGLAEVGFGNAVIFGDPSTLSEGLVGTFRFRLTAELPDAGTAVWVLLVEIGSSSKVEDIDGLTFDSGQLGVRLVRRFANRVFNLDLTRRFDGGAFAWESRLPGLADTVRVRAPGDSVWTAITSARATGIGSDVATAAGALLAARLTLADSAAADTVLAGAGLSPPYGAAFLNSVDALERRLLSRKHVVSVDSLTADTQYGYEVRSTSLDGRPSNRLTGTFRTRRAPDLRPAVGTDIDVQATRTTVTATWFTNRPADTRLRISDSLDATVGVVRLNAEGSLVHSASLGGLKPGTLYGYTITSRLTAADDLVGKGLLSEDQATVVKSGTFRTSARGRPLRLLGPPTRTVSPEAAVIGFRLNQIALATVSYGAVVADSTAPLYTESVRSGDPLTAHSITLADLTPTTFYRFRITVVTPDGDSLSTDPRGNRQWSRDLGFTTSAAGDTLPPVIVEGPVVTVRDVLAVVRFVTDVDTRATVFFGTSGGTYGTADEFEVADRTPDGGLRLTQDHALTVAGLVPGQDYDYGILVEATNGQTASFEPNLPAGKAARAGKRLKVLQPPGGAGSFTTSSDPDTRFPVILTGPTVSSKTHQTAIIEWTTDEPATSQVDFGVEDPGAASQASGTNRTRHKVVLTNLEPASTYLYRVGSTDAAGNGATLSSQALFATNPEVDLTAPRIATDPRVTYKTDEAATVHWTTDEDATAQVLFGTQADQLDFVRTSSLTGTEHDLTLTNLEPAITYYYQVSSADLSNNGPTSSEVLSFTTDAEADLTAPTIDSIAVAAADSTAILSWSTDELADSFVDVGALSGILDVTEGNATDVVRHEVVLTNLTPGQVYFYTVGSSDRSGNGPTQSPELSFTTLTGADVTPPGAPTDPAATAGSRQAVLSWSRVAELDLAGYNVYRRVAGADTFAAVASRLATTQYTDLGLSDGVTYEYRVTAIDRTTPPNESTPSSVVTVTPSLSEAPTTPTGLRVSGPALNPTFRFDNATPFNTSTALTYTVQVSTQPDFSDVAASTSGLVAGSDSTSWTPPRTLEDGITYYWRVRAVEGTLLGPFSETQVYLASTRPALAGDLDDSGAVDLVDFFLFADAYLQPAADHPLADMDGSGDRVDLVDFFLFADAYGSGSGKEAGLAQALPLDKAAILRLEVAGGPLGGAGLERGAVRLRLRVERVAAVSAYGLVLAWDPAALAFSAVRPAAEPLLSTATEGLFRVLEQRPGRLTVVAAHPGAPVAGSGGLVEVAFRVRDRRLLADGELRVLEAYLAAGLDVRRLSTPAAARLLPARFALGPAYPNPFNPSTSIDFALPVATPARLVVYDVLGRPVRTLVDSREPLPAGFHAVTWDGRDEAGRLVGNGLYLYRLETSNSHRSGKMMLLK